MFKIQKKVQNRKSEEKIANIKIKNEKENKKKHSQVEVSFYGWTVSESEERGVWQGGRICRISTRDGR